jgi:Erv1 / Alr family
MTIFNKVPCGSCANHYRELVEKIPAPTDQSQLFSWTVEIHNHVNAKVVKNSMSEDVAHQIYDIFD